MTARLSMSETVNSRQELRSKVFSGVRWALFSKVCVTLVTFLSSVVTVRYLGMEDFGTYSLVKYITSLVLVVAGLGMTQAIMRFSAELRVNGDYAGILNLVGKGALSQVLIWGLFSLAAVAGSGALASLYSREVQDLLLLSLGLIIFGLLWESFYSALLAFYDNRFLAVATVVYSLTGFFAMLFMLSAGFGVAGIIIALALPNAAGVFFLRWRIRRLAGDAPARTGAGMSGDAVRRGFRYALPFIGINLINMVVQRQSEVLFLGYYWTKEDVGLFSLAYGFPQFVLEFLPLQLYPIMLVTFTTLFVEDRTSLMPQIERFYRYLFAILVPVAFIGFSLGDDMLLLIYGEASAGALPYARAFFLIFLMGFFGLPMSMMAYAAERPMVIVKTGAVTAVLNIILNTFLIRAYRMEGALLSMVLTLCFGAALNYVVVRKYILPVSVPFRDIFKILFCASPLLALSFFDFSRPENALLCAVILFSATAATLLLYRQMSVFSQGDLGLFKGFRIPYSDYLLRFMERTP